jgi:hypothetical protein
MSNSQMTNNQWPNMSKDTYKRRFFDIRSIHYFLHQYLLKSCIFLNKFSQLSFGILSFDQMSSRQKVDLIFLFPFILVGKLPFAFVNVNSKRKAFSGMNFKTFYSHFYLHTIISYSVNQWQSLLP